jgi:hypothetical protein
VLRIDGHAYSATILHRILHMAAVSSSFEQAQVSLDVVGELTISARHITNLSKELGGQMVAARDEQTDQFVHQPLPRQKTKPTTSIDVAAVFLDGGRIRTREPGCGPGVHNPHWRENKNASFHRMTSVPSAVDPQPELPDCFRNQAYVEKLVRGLKNQAKQSSDEACPPEDAARQSPANSLDLPAWQPKTVFRTCLSSLATSEKFGPLMAAAADARGFFQAARRAYVGDGQAYNWTIHQRWFPDFVAIADFVHVVEYLYEAAQAMHHDQAAHWQPYVAWAEACWQGRVTSVIAQLEKWQSDQEPLSVEHAADNDPRRIVASTITYLNHNRSRMDYPNYRRAGLPVTSSLAESLVKQMSKRVKGTEMFWDDGASGEAILQLRAAVISDGTPLAEFIATRPISPYSPRCRSAPLTSLA